MTGLPLFNFPAFDAARDMLLSCGEEVFSPADLDRQLGFDPIKNPDTEVTEAFLSMARERDIEAIKDAKAIYMLDGWEKSVGARAEFALAQWYGLSVTYQTEPCRKVAISDIKPHESCNPKDIAGSKKCPMHLLPPVALEKTAWVHGIGAAKYQKFNWRDKQISASQYVAAIMRHLMAWHYGQDDDTESGITHLAHIGATVNILMDSEDNGCLIDDRPVRVKSKC